MNSPSRSKAWERIRTLENALAILCRIEERRKIIRAHAWRQGSWKRVLIESTRMRADSLQLKELLSERWDELYAEVTGDDGG